MRWFVFGALGLLLVFHIYRCKGDPSNSLAEDRYELKHQCVTLLREQVNLEMHASLTYMNMAAHFDKNSVARRGFANFFEWNAREERSHAQKLIDYLNLRGSFFTRFKVDMPKQTTWVTALDAIIDAIALEKHLNNKLNSIHDAAEGQCKDPHLMGFLEREYLGEQVKSIDTLLRYKAILEPMKDSDLSEYLVDRQLVGESVSYFKTESEETHRSPTFCRKDGVSDEIC